MPGTMIQCHIFLPWAELNPDVFEGFSKPLSQAIDASEIRGWFRQLAGVRGRGTFKRILY